MSFNPDDIEHESDLTTLLGEIAKQLKLLNAKFEESFPSGIGEEDIE